MTIYFEKTRFLKHILIPIILLICFFLTHEKMKAEDYILPPTDSQNVFLKSIADSDEILCVVKKKLVIWNLRKGKISSQIANYNTTAQYSLSPNGKYLLTDSALIDEKTSGRIRTYGLSYWDLNKKKLINSISCDANLLNGKMINADGIAAIISHQNKELPHQRDTEFFIWDPNNKNVKSFSDINLVLKFDERRTVAFSPDARYLAYSDGKSIRTFDIKTRQLKHRFIVKNSFNGALKFSPSGRYLLFRDGSSIVICDLQTGKKKHNLYLKLPDCRIKYEVSHNEKYVAVCSNYLGIFQRKEKMGKILIWELTSGKQVYQEGIEERAVVDICFCLGGDYLIALGKKSGFTIRNISIPNIDNDELKKGKLKKRKNDNSRKKRKGFFGLF